MRTTNPAILALTLGVPLALAAAPAQKPQVADVLKAAAAYLTEYSQTIAVTA